MRCRQDEGRINACDPHRVPLVFRICEDDWENSVLCRDRVATSLVIAKGNSNFKLQSEHESSLVTATYGVCPKCCAEEAPQGVLFRPRNWFSCRGTHREWRQGAFLRNLEQSSSPLEGLAYGRTSVAQAVGHKPMKGLSSRTRRGQVEEAAPGVAPCSTLCLSLTL